MNVNAVKFSNLLQDIPIKRGVKKSTIKQLLSYMASWTDMDSNEFYLACAKIVAETGLSKEVVITTRKWIKEIGLIRATNRSVNGCTVYKFTFELNMSTDAALLTAKHSSNYKSPLKNINRLKTPQPEQQIFLSENSDTHLSENSDTHLSENSDTKEEPKNKKKTSCAKKPIKSLSVIQEESTQKDEGEEGFIFIKSILKTCKKINEMKLMGEKHSIHSINCYHLELLNDIKSGRARSIGALLSRLENSGEWIGKPPMVITTGGNKPSQQTHINLVSGYKAQKQAKENSNKTNDKEACGNAAELYRQMLANG
jgi:hypothetical protein